MPFEPGQSGNPAGRPPGARSKRSMLVESTFADEAEAVARQAIEQAKAGDMAAIRMIVDRLAPARRDRPIDFALPPLITARDSVTALAAVAAALANGELTPSEATALCKLIDSQLRALEATTFEERLTKL
jgi:Family of unknown function (DUF5681)